MLAAYFYPATKRGPATLDIVRIVDGERTPITTIAVPSKRTARTVAAAHGAVWWN